MKTLYELAILTLIFVFFSCNNSDTKIEETETISEPELKIVEEYINDSTYRIEYQVNKLNGKKHGYFKEYNESGLFISRNYIDDLMEGEEIVYYPGTEKIESKFYYKKGVYHGEYFYYFEDGSTKQKGEMIEGKIEGMLTTYYPNGKIKDEVVHKNGVTDGPFREFNEEGILITEGIYSTKGEAEELEEGMLKIYADDGSLKSRMICSSGKCCTIWTNDDGDVAPSSDMCKAIIESYKKEQE